MWNDLRFVFRTLRRSPGFTLVAILSLALGIGANAAIFSLLYQVVLRSVPVAHPETLVAVESDDSNSGWTRRDNSKSVFSYPMYRELRDRSQVFSGLVGRASFQAVLSYRGEATPATAEVVTGNFFQVLGLKPALGRALLPSDDAPGQDPAIVLSYSYWSTHLGADPSVLNTRILLNSQPVLIAGVAPRGFRGLLAGQSPDFFAPVAMMSVVSPGWRRNDMADSYWLSIFGRLTPGVTPERARAILTPLFHSILENQLPRLAQLPGTRRRVLSSPLTVQSGAQGLNELSQQWRAPLTVLMVMVGLVLLIACTNIANLLVARANARQREIAVRIAIGAGQWQLARQLLVESIVLAMTGGLLGLLLSTVLTAGLLRLLPYDAAGGWLNARLDPRLLLYSMALALLTGLLFGLIPALQAGKTDLVTGLKARGAGADSRGSQPRIRQALVVAQISISLLLLVGAGLFTRSLVNLIRNDPGFRPDHLVTFDIDPSLNGYTRERTLALFREVQQKLNGLPGVTSVSNAEFAPFGGSNWGGGVKAPGSRAASQEFAQCSENSVGPRYFSTLGIPLLAGREFDARDDEHSAKAAIINESFARFLFENDSPLGRHMTSGGDDLDLQIVGVVKDSKYGDVRETPTHFLFVPYEQGTDDFTRRTTFFVRTRNDERGVMAAVRSTVKQVDPYIPVDRLTSMRSLIDDSIYTDRLLATLAIGFGILASILAAIGLYGTISYSVARRTREFGIRLALGAAPRGLLLSIIREMGRLIVIGVGVALPVSYALARLVESELFGIRAHDPLVLAGGTLLIVVVASAASLGPALRAMRIEPLRALREE